MKKCIYKNKNSEAKGVCYIRAVYASSGDAVVAEIMRTIYKGHCTEFQRFDYSSYSADYFLKCYNDFVRMASLDGYIVFPACNISI